MVAREIRQHQSPPRLTRAPQWLSLTGSHTQSVLGYIQGSGSVGRKAGGVNGRTGENAGEESTSHVKHPR